jgi:hypothetical protein
MRPVLRYSRLTREVWDLRDMPSVTKAELLAIVAEVNRRGWTPPGVMQSAVCCQDDRNGTLVSRIKFTLWNSTQYALCGANGEPIELTPADRKDGQEFRFLLLRLVTCKASCDDPNWCDDPRYEAKQADEAVAELHELLRTVRAVRATVTV